MKDSLKKKLRQIPEFRRIFLDMYREGPEEGLWERALERWLSYHAKLCEDRKRRTNKRD